MKKLLASALAALGLSLVTACGGAGAAASAAGTYELDKAALKAMAMADVPADQRSPEAEKMMGQMFDGMNVSLDLKADGTAAYNAKMSLMGQQVDESATGTWKLEGSKLTMVTKDKAGKEETKTGDYANGVLTLQEDMGGKTMKMTFKRK